MIRREFTRRIATGVAVAAWLSEARAQGAPVEGQQYVRLSPPAPVTLPSPDKKIDVVEFFWYGSPACHALEPLLQSWSKRLPADVSLRRVHVGFGPIHQVHQRLYYALEAIGAAAGIHERVYAAIHLRGRRLLTEPEIVAFVKDAGIDADAFTRAYHSPGVDKRASDAKQLTDAYKIDGVPALGIQGRYYTSAGLAGSLRRMIGVADYLIQRARRG